MKNLRLRALMSELANSEMSGEFENISNELAQKLHGGENNGSCPTNGSCPNNGSCPTDGSCPTNGSCPHNGSCPNNGSC